MINNSLLGYSRINAFSLVFEQFDLSFDDLLDFLDSFQLCLKGTLLLEATDSK